jgi:putative acetyltransferase
MNSTTRGPGLRPFLPADAPRLAELFRASVTELASEHYDHDQLAAWIGAATDEAAFAKRLAESLTIVALVGGDVAGFAALRDGKHFDMLYVSPHAARQGVGSALADAIEKLAQARGAQSLDVDASDAARDFFAQRGYVAQKRNIKTIGDEWLANTTMTKDVAPRARAGLSPGLAQ